MSAPTYRQEDLVRQPIGFWSGEAYRRVAEAIRGSLAGLATADGDSITMTAAGSERLAAARDRNGRAHRDMLTGIGDDEYATTIDVLRRIVGNLGGAARLP